MERDKLLEIVHSKLDETGETNIESLKQNENYLRFELQKSLAHSSNLEVINLMKNLFKHVDLMQIISLRLK